MFIGSLHFFVSFSSFVDFLSLIWISCDTAAVVDIPRVVPKYVERSNKNEVRWEIYNLVTTGTVRESHGEPVSNVVEKGVGYRRD